MAFAETVAGDLKTPGQDTTKPVELTGRKGRLYLLTHWGWDKMAVISQTTISNAFPWMKIYKFQFRFYWSLFPRVQLTSLEHWSRWWLGAEQVTSHYLNLWCPRLLMHICITQPQWVKRKYKPTYWMIVKLLDYDIWFCRLLSGGMSGWLPSNCYIGFIWVACIIRFSFHIVLSNFFGIEWAADCNIQW